MLPRCLTLTHGAVLPLVLLLSQCEHKDKEAPPVPPGTSSVQPAATAVTPAPAKPKFAWTEELMHKEIKFHNPAYEGNGQFRIENGEPIAVGLDGAKVSNLKCLAGRTSLTALYLSGTDVADLSPITGLPLTELYIERTKVRDLTPLKGMPLKKLYLTGTPVQDLGALEGMPLTDFNAKDTGVTDLSPLRKSPLAMVWLTGCPVENIAPLRGLPLVSLTLHFTRVKDLSPLSGSALQRLHIGETPVENLTPLQGLHLSRLVFTPDRIKKGIEVAKALPLREVGTRFIEEGNDLKPPAEFWVGK
ncbi:MAG: leucine-rich repeat domain-containing protein [Verrucomicrobium sp.]